MNCIKHTNAGLRIVGGVSFIILVIAACALFAQTSARTGAAVSGDTVQVNVTYPLSATKPIPLTIPKGTIFRVTLPSNPTTGYSWALAGTLSTRVLRKIDSRYIAPPQTNPPTAGRGGVEEWSFIGVGTGTQTVTLNYARPWEKNKPPAKTQQFLVTVK